MYLLLITGLSMRMKWTNVVLTLSLLLFVCNNPSAAAQVPFSADDFDWRETVPYLFAAATMPDEEAIKTMLENSKVLRSYVAQEVRMECKPGNDRCDSSRDGFTVNGEVTKRIDGIVREGIVHRHKTAVVDYVMDGKSFPFSEIAAVRSDNRQDAYFILQLSDRFYTAAQLQAKYGVPYDTDIFQWYSVFKYKLDSADYTGKAVFEIDPTDGAVLKVAVSLKTKKHH
jgi:hypothetical protein